MIFIYRQSTPSKIYLASRSMFRPILDPRDPDPHMDISLVNNKAVARKKRHLTNFVSITIPREHRKHPKLLCTVLLHR